jgi:hypothetical protein
MSTYEKFYSKNSYKKNFFNTDRSEKPYNIDFYNYTFTKRNNFANNIYYSCNNLENMNQYNSSGEMLKPHENILELELEFKQLKNSLNELNKKLKEKDKIISTLKRKIYSISTKNSENQKNNLTINIKENNFLRTIDNEKYNNHLFLNNPRYFRNKYSYSFQNNTNNIQKDETINSNKNPLGHSNLNLSTTIKNTEYNSTIKSRLSQENSLVKQKPLTLTYFRYQKELEKKKNKNIPNLIRTNLFYQIKNKNDESDIKKKIRNKHLSLLTNKNENGNHFSIDDTKKTKNKSNDNKFEDNKKKNVNDKNSPKNKKSNQKSPTKLKQICLTAKIKQNKEKNNLNNKTIEHTYKNEEKLLKKRKQLNKNKIDISKKRLYKMGITYKELHEIKVFHNKVYSESKNENKKNIKNLIGDFIDEKRNKNKINFESEKETSEKKSNIKYNKKDKNENENIKQLNIKDKTKRQHKIKFIDMDDNKEKEKLYENIEEKNLLEIKNILQNEINSFSRKTEDKKDIDNKKDDSLSIQIELDSKLDLNNSNIDINFDNKSNENLLLNLNDYNNQKDSYSSENLLTYSGKQKDIYKINEPKASIIKSSSSKELSFERTFSDIQITVNNLDIPFNGK